MVGDIGGHNPNFDARQTANPDVGGAIAGAIWYTVSTFIRGNEWNAADCGWAALGGAILGSTGAAVRIGNIFKIK